jgi:very-short-patch-repair endonuclease
VKKINASDIWRLDEQRTKILENCGYFVITIWESDYNKNEWQTTLRRILEKHEKKDIDAL